MLVTSPQASVVLDNGCACLYNSRNIVKRSLLSLPTEGGPVVITSPDNPIQAILRTAIQREIEAHTLYRETAQRFEDGPARELLLDLSAQELGHRNRLEALLQGDLFRVLSRAQARQVEDYQITDHLIETPLAPDASVQEVLIVAGKREKGSHDLYAALARLAEEAAARQLFEFLASEELLHKQRIETLYEQLVYPEN